MKKDSENKKIRRINKDYPFPSKDTKWTKTKKFKDFLKKIKENDKKE